MPSPCAPPGEMKGRVPEEKNSLIQCQCENALMARECR